MSFYMATTKIESHKTSGEITSLLSKRGVSEILTGYENGEITSLSFRINRGGILIPFKLPIKYKQVLEAMKRDRGTPRHLCNEAQAIRTAWRLILRWVEAQLAMVECGAADLEEVFMPYAQISNEETVYERFQKSKFKLLGSGK